MIPTKGVHSQPLTAEQAVTQQPEQSFNPERFTVMC
jgi:hypothetical protein